MSETSPRQIDDYRIIRPVGASGSFVVYRATTDGEGEVALKVSVERSARELAHLRRERELAEHLRLPGLRRIWEVGLSAEGLIYAAMEWADASLRSRMGDGHRFSRGDAIKYLMPVAETLDEMHSRQYIHCNLTPEHILLCADGRVLVGGLAQARRRGQHPIEGDPRYSSPERMSGQPVGPWCDIYSLGAIAYEMMTGKPPYEPGPGESMETPQAIQTPEIPRSVRRSLGRDASRALVRALAKEPSDRFHSAVSFVQALQEQEPTSMRLRHEVEYLARRAVRFVQNVPRSVKVVGLVLVTLAVAGGLVLSGAQRRETVEEDPRTATAAFVAALQTPDSIWTPQPLQTVTPSPTGASTLAVAQQANQTATAAAATSVAVTSAAASPAPTATATATPRPTQAALRPAPVLLEPADVTRFAADASVDLVWQYDGQLASEESFDIRMWKPGEPAWGIARSTETRYRLKGPPHGPGEYTWQIVVVRDDPQTGKVVETSRPSSTRRIFWG